MPGESRRRSGNGFCPGERGKTSNCCEVGCGVYETCGIRGPECEKTKIGSRKPVKRKISRRNVLGWKSLPRFANFPRNSSSQPFPWETRSPPTPHRESRLECKEQHASHRARRALSLVERRDSGVQDSRRSTNHLIGFSSKTRPWNSKNETKSVPVRVWTWDQGHSLALCVLRLCE